MFAKKLNYIAQTKRKNIYEYHLNSSISELRKLCEKAAEDGKFGIKHQIIFNEEFEHMKEDMMKSFENDGFEVYINSSVRNPHTENTKYIFDIVLRWGKSYDDHTP